MAKRLTPLERIAAGEPLSKQARYEERLRRQGIHRVTLMVPAARIDELRALCARWVAEVRHDD